MELIMALEIFYSNICTIFFVRVKQLLYINMLDVQLKLKLTK